MLDTHGIIKGLRLITGASIDAAGALPYYTHGPVYRPVMSLSNLHSTIDRAILCAKKEADVSKQNYKTDEYRAWNCERMRIWRERNREKHLAIVKRYKQSPKGALNAKSSATKKSKKKWELNNPGYHKSYYHKNGDRIRLMSRQRASKYLAKKQVASHKRRAKKRGNGGSYTLLEWHALCRKYDFRCLKCGKRAPDIKLTVDHIIPIELGGTSNIDNLQPLCFECNSGKGARTIDYRPETTEREQYAQLSFF